MTAVIGILNKRAAVIAADSAVTISNGSGRKILNGANKMFRLCKTAAVGIMIYNNGSFLRTPWDPIIYTYRNFIGDVKFNTLFEYHQSFLDFLKTNNFFCTAKERIDYAFGILKNDIGNIILRIDESIPDYEDDPDDTLYYKELIGKLTEYRDRMIVNKTILPDFVGYSLDDFKSETKYNLNLVIAEMFHDPFPADILLQIAMIAYEICYNITVHDIFYESFTGLVFVGYGELEIFPQLSSVYVSFAIGNRLKYHINEKEKTSITHSSNAAIRPFAQKDVIDTILTGVDPTLDAIYTQHFKDFFVKYNEQIAQLADNESPNLAQKIRSAISPDLVVNQLRKFISNERRKNYIAPLMGAIDTLSKEDLAEMAESLIHLTYLKRRFTSAQESVGGPVDVAVITKGEGFIWIKRKHYFEPNLNHHYIKNI